MTERHALLVEDSEIIALDTEDMLLDLGYKTVTIARTCAEAFAVLDQHRPTVAVLDVNLDRETSFPVAERLAADGIPFVFATGYGMHAHFPESLVGRPVVSKPYSPDSMRRALEKAATG